MNLLKGIWWFWKDTWLNAVNTKLLSKDCNPLQRIPLLWAAFTNCTLYRNGEWLSSQRRIYAQEVHHNISNWWEFSHWSRRLSQCLYLQYLLAYIWSKPVQQISFGKILLLWAGFFLPERVPSSSLDVISNIFNFRSLVLASLLISLSNISK